MSRCSSNKRVAVRWKKGNDKEVKKKGTETDSYLSIKPPVGGVWVPQPKTGKKKG